MMSVIEINNLTKQFGKNRGIDGVNLKVNQGDFFGFIGPNGAGKSTTIKLLFNFIYPTSGSANILGMDMIKDTVKIKKRVAYVPSEVRLYGEMKVSELLKMTLEFNEIKEQGELEKLCQLFQIELDKKIKNLSLGNKKKIAIVAALLTNPELIILDEPTSGLDPLMQKHLFDILLEKNKEGLTVFLSSHTLTEVEEYCSKVAFIKEGKITLVDDLTNQVDRGKVITLLGADKTDELVNIGAVLENTRGKRLVFSYQGPQEPMIDALGKMSFLDITIENPSLESQFLEYYKGGEDDGQ